MQTYLPTAIKFIKILFHSFHQLFGHVYTYHILIDFQEVPNAKFFVKMIFKPSQSFLHKTRYQLLLKFNLNNILKSHT